MKRIIKGEVPEYWANYIKKHPHDTYDSENDEIAVLRSTIRNDMLREQKYICAYCSRAIESDKCHNEHIKPRDRFDNLSMDYNNIVVSCNCENTCGKYKENNYDEKAFVSPLDSNCEEQFEYDLSGRVYGKTDAANKTIEILNLNNNGLKNARRALLNECLKCAETIGYDVEQYIQEYYILPKDGKLQRFCDMIQFFYEEGYFDEDSIIERL